MRWHCRDASIQSDPIHSLPIIVCTNCQEHRTSMYHGWPGGTTKTVWQCARHVYFIFEKNCVCGSVFVCVSVYMYISMFVCVCLSKHLKGQLGSPVSDEKCLSVRYFFIHNNVFVYSQRAERRRREGRCWEHPKTVSLPDDPVLSAVGFVVLGIFIWLWVLLSCCLFPCVSLCLCLSLCVSVPHAVKCQRVWCDMCITEEFWERSNQIWRDESYQILEIST